MHGIWILDGSRRVPVENLREDWFDSTAVWSPNRSAESGRRMSVEGYGQSVQVAAIGTVDLGCRMRRSSSDGDSKQQRLAGLAATARRQLFWTIVKYPSFYCFETL